MQVRRLDNTGWASKARGWKIKAQQLSWANRHLPPQWQTCRRMSEAWRGGHDPHLPAPLAKEARRPSWRPSSLNNPNAAGLDPSWVLNGGQTFQPQSHTQENAVFTCDRGRFISIKTRRIHDTRLRLHVEKFSLSLMSHDFRFSQRFEAAFH